ncbi:Putative lipoprotein [Vulgatibacter incomptus]|uniref:Putative lipoprotein n=2 Tax=Vulgatibacter incomptus TaxID=1391653 RepID=A0A0K1PBA8_9BACT|nr:Putative lipoprotein [Vulgatibacter incomptus]
MVRAGFLLSIFLSMALVPASARASDPDPWFGHDKFLHFSVSNGLAAGGYAVSSLFWEGRTERLIAGGSFSLALGAAKELYDMTGRGDPSWRDFTWDVIGTATGLALAWGIDELFFRSDARKPVEAAATPGGLAIRW